MLKPDETEDWRESRRQFSRRAILDAACAVVHAEGLGSLSIRGLASRAGITSPTVYAYFESKNAIYDAMFGQAATDFAEFMAEPHQAGDPEETLVASLRRFIGFCTSDVARYQLLFQRPIPASSLRRAPMHRLSRRSPTRTSDWGSSASLMDATWTCGPRWAPVWWTSRSPMTRVGIGGFASSTML